MKNYLDISFTEDIDKQVTILPVSEKEDDDEFWTNEYIKQYGEIPL